jgi:hypothetical protein
VKTRLEPRFRKLEDAYVPAYVDQLMTLDSLQGDVEDARSKVASSAELRVLEEFGDFQEARRMLDKARQDASEAPRALRKRPEDRDAAERDVRAAGSVKDTIDNEALTFRKLAKECDVRRDAAKRLGDTPRAALRGFASFLLSPRVTERLRAVKDGPKALADVLGAKSEDELADVLATMPNADIKTLAKLLVAVVGDRRPKNVRLAEFEPRSGFVWEEADIDTVVGEFRDYLKKAWEDGHYLKLEKE